MTMEEFAKAKFFSGMKMLTSDGWKIVSSVDFETGIHESSEGLFYPLQSVKAYSEMETKTDA